MSKLCDLILSSSKTDVNGNYKNTYLTVHIVITFITLLGIAFKLTKSYNI